MDRRVVRPSVEHEVDEEFSFHVEMRVRDLVQRGWSAEEARAEAVRRFGDIERVKANCRELGTGRDVRMSRGLWWDGIRQDLGYALRQLRRAPSFAMVAILTLGIGIGANTAVFSVVNGVLFKPLPFPEPEELVVVWTRYLPPSGFDIPKFALSGPEYFDYRESTTVLESLGAFAAGSRALTGEGRDAERLRVGFLTQSVLPTLGVQPLLGRWFEPEEDIAQGPAVTILGYDVWTNRYGSDPELVGRSILLNGISTEVVGVMPEGFEFPRGTQAWLPAGLDRSNAGGRGAHGNSAIGRLAPGMTQADLDAELGVLRDRWAQEFEHNEAHFLWAQGIHTEYLADAPQRLFLLMSAVALVLLVACANVANLLLARAERRQEEMALRRTLGAGRARVTRQLATESFALAGVSSVLGLALAFGGTRLLISIDPEALPRLGEVTMDGSVLLFTLCVTILTALLFGIAPAYLTGRRATAALASSASRAVGSRRRASLRGLLVTGEVALSLVVVILAGLVVRSFTALTNTDPRMNPDDLLTFSLTLPAAGYPDDELIPAEYEAVLARIRTLPGVTDASAATSLPFGGTGFWDFQLDDRPARQDGDLAWNAGLSHVATDYFETLGIPILEGRALTAQDGRTDPPVAVVSEAMADRFWPGESVIGQRFGYEMAEDSVPWMTIVGLVPDPVTSSLEADPYPHVYVPAAQAGISTYFVPRSLRIAVRTGVAAEGLVPSVRAAVQGFDADLPLYDLATMEDVVAESFAGPRITSNLLGTFAAIALVLATVGIYGVISYSVAGRTREIGVRVALGAERGEIIRMILGEGARPVVAGVMLGLAGAWFATELVDAMLYGVGATDPVTFSLIPLGLLGLGLLASWLPALRATRIGPIEALREE